MTNHHLDRISRDLAVEQSLDAAIEVDGVLTGIRKGSSALAELLQTLTFDGPGGGGEQHALMDNSQMAALYHRAVSASGREFETTADLEAVVRLLAELNTDELSGYDKGVLEFIREFCLGLNCELVSEAYRRTPEPAIVRSNPRELTVNEY